MVGRGKLSTGPAPTVLKALGRKRFPEHIDLAGGRFRLAEVLKHDFFAATALYRRADGRQVVLKIGRSADILGLPARWIGRFLARREARIYRALSDVASVPDFSGMWSDCGFAHDYVEGHPLRRDEAVGDEFFDQLQTLIATIHARNMAYVDLEKCENLIVGQDGRPHLIDFQISWSMPALWERCCPPLAWFRKKLQHMDEYHLLKHRRRARPDQLTPEQLDESYKLPGWIRMHRVLVRPLQKIRRLALKKLDADYLSAPR